MKRLNMNTTWMMILATRIEESDFNKFFYNLIKFRTLIKF